MEAPKSWQTDLENMVYIIRDEGTLPLEVLVDKYGKQNVEKAQAEFMSGLKHLMQDTFPKAKVIAINAEKQIEKTQADLVGKKTISLDTYYKGNYNLEITRLFRVTDGKTEFIKLVSRPSYQSIRKQIEAIEPGEYTLVDDDAIGGRTIKAIKEMMPSGVNITETYLMMDSYRNKNNQPILDVVDCRDFIVGVQGCGLTTLINEVNILRLPYVYPFVDIEDKANIPSGMELDVSYKIWELNKNFWDTLDPLAKLTETGGVDLAKMYEHYKLGDASEVTVQQAIDKLSNMVKLGVVA